MNKNLINYIEHDLGYKKISEAVLSQHGKCFSIDNKSINYEPQYLETINTLWNEEEFSRINLPKILFSLNNEEISSYTNGGDIRVLDMPIKFPNSDYRIPEELVSIIPLIKKIATNEHSINPKIDDYYCYLTLDRRLVKAGNTTRKAGIHVDGFQGARLGEKLPVDHSYLLANVLPTLFYEQAFKVNNNWDKMCHNYFEGFAQQKVDGSVRTYPNNSVLLVDAYCLHEAPMVLEDTYRTFLRMSYTVREFDRLGNAHNGMFEYEWEMFPRDIQSTLICPI